jgi:predicted secreted hydrolase
VNSRRLIWLLSACLTGAAVSAEDPAAVVPGVTLQFPSDYGAHPSYGVEWWYLTGWLSAPSHEQLGFQVTFFRSRVADPATNPSAFTARQLLIAHCALSDPARGHLWQDQRIRRAGLDLAQAQSDDTRVWVDDWRLERDSAGYHTQLAADGFALDLTLGTTQPMLLNGEQGFSQKGPQRDSASEYYSEPQLRVSGRITRGSLATTVSGVAWLDHEWSSQYLDPRADGWDWVGLNMDDGAAVMAFRIRDHQGHTFWAGGTERDRDGRTRSLQASQIQFEPKRVWRSPRSGVTYPVSWQLLLDGRTLQLEPLMDDQENDTRLSVGAIYWEGAVRVFESQHEAGKGYLELTGYDKPLSLR